MKKVAVLIGSASDKSIMQPCLQTLRMIGIPFMATISSAHRTPERTVQIVKEAEKEGVQVFICAAGMAAHLAGAVAAHTICPVIAVPVAGAVLGGLDALLSTIQMPSGFPVAAVALNGAKNAALLAAQILALHDNEIQKRLAEYRQHIREEIEIEAARMEEEAIM